MNANVEKIYLSSQNYCCKQVFVQPDCTLKKTGKAECGKLYGKSVVRKLCFKASFRIERLKFALV